MRRVLGKKKKQIERVMKIHILCWMSELTLKDRVIKSLKWPQ